MLLEEYIKPVSNEHSIKEAVISLFLASPIIKPERFKTLIEKDFKDTFQKFEPVNQLEFQFSSNQPNINQQLNTNVGFRFSSFDKGEIATHLQGINEKQRFFISYHTLKYRRWKNFLEEYKKIIKSLLGFQSDFFISHLSVHYIDQFYWVNENEDISLKKIFQAENKYISKELFDSKIKSYNIVTEQKIDDKTYLDRLEIITNEEIGIKPMISISHNTTQKFADYFNLKELDSDDYLYNSILQNCHQRNKDILSNLLTDEVKDMIHFKTISNE